MAIVAALLLLVPSAAHAQGTQEILRDCARRRRPRRATTPPRRCATPATTCRPSSTSTRDCRDVLTRAIADKTAKPKSDDASGGDSSGGGGGTAAAAAAAPAAAAATRTPARAERDAHPGAPAAPTPAARSPPRRRSGPRSPRPRRASTRTRTTSSRSRPARNACSADVGRNALPGTLIGVLALIAAAAFALVAVPLIRRVAWVPRQTVGRTSRGRRAERSSRRSTSRSRPRRRRSSAASRSRSCCARSSRAAGRSSSAPRGPTSC